MSHGVLFDWVDRLSKPGRLITYLMVGGETITQVNNITLANTITLGSPGRHREEGLGNGNGLLLRAGYQVYLNKTAEK